MNDQKLDRAELKERSVYVNNEKIVTWEKETIKSDFPKLFDSDAGAKYHIERIGETNKEEKPQQQYDKTGKAQKMTKQERAIIKKLYNSLHLKIPGSLPEEASSLSIETHLHLVLWQACDLPLNIRS
ncbi:MAG: hypothetical protein JRJ42_10535 [Deltaproteobacteria bacterium]|nr:hypothetical protein [Deltaproteobacteria bacterium]